MRDTRFCFASSRLRSAVTFALVAEASACSRVAVACASAARYGAVSTHALAQACLHEGIRPMLTEDRRGRDRSPAASETDGRQP